MTTIAKKIPSQALFFEPSLKRNLNIQRQSFSRLNLEGLKYFISYLNQLRRDGIIGEKELMDLLILVCSNYVENEVGRILDKTLEKSLEKSLMKVF
jgi:hypothetical protein